MSNIVNCFQNTHTEGNRKPFDPSTLYKAMQQENQDLLNGKMQDAQEFWMRIVKSMEEIKCCKELDGLFSHDFISIVKCDNCGIKTQIDYKASGHVIAIRCRSTIQEAVNAYFAEEDIEEYTCSVCICNKNTAKKNFFFKNAPKCLVLVLSWFDSGLKKCKDYIALTDQLKLSDILEDSTAQLNYTLVSTINHYGSKCSNGHYTAISCSEKNEFHEFDDNCVRSTNVIGGRAAYILIYELAEVLYDVLKRAVYK